MDEDKNATILKLQKKNKKLKRKLKKLKTEEVKVEQTETDRIQIQKVEEENETFYDYDYTGFLELGSSEDSHSSNGSVEDLNEICEAELKMSEAGQMPKLFCEITNNLEEQKSEPTGGEKKHKKKKEKSNKENDKSKKKKKHKKDKKEKVIYKESQLGDYAYIQI